MRIELLINGDDEVRLLSGHLKRVESVVQPADFNIGGLKSMELIQNLNEQQLDPQWVALILDAREMGMSIDDIRKSLSNFQEALSMIMLP